MRERLDVAGLLSAAVLVAVLLIAFASRACPSATEADTCPEAALNRALVIALAAASVLLIVTPFAFLAEFAARRRIVYRGAWSRAARRGALVALIVAALGGLRLGGVLSPQLSLAVVLAPLAVEAYLSRSELRRGGVT